MGVQYDKIRGCILLAGKIKTEEQKSQPQTKANTPTKSKIISETKIETITLKYLSTLTGLSESWLKQLQQSGVITPLPNNGNRKAGNQYEQDKTISSLFRYYRQLVDSRGAKESEDTAKTKDAILKVKLKKEYLELKQLEGSLCDAEEVIRLVGGAISTLRINLLALPLGVAPLIRNRENVNEIAEIIRERIYRALKGVATINLKKLKADEAGIQSE